MQKVDECIYDQQYYIVAPHGCDTILYQKLCLYLTSCAYKYCLLPFPFISNNFWLNFLLCAIRCISKNFISGGDFKTKLEYKPSDHKSASNRLLFMCFQHFAFIHRPEFRVFIAAVIDNIDDCGRDYCLLKLSSPKFHIFNNLSQTGSQIILTKW